MRRYSLSGLPDSILVQDLTAVIVRERGTTADVLAHIGEFDARKLYRPAAHPSMFSYCVGELHLSEDAAYKRIQAARAARKVPAIFGAVADGRLHLAAVCLLAPHLSRENADTLIAAATRKSKSDIERLLAERFPRPDVPERVRAITFEALVMPHAEPADVAGSTELPACARPVEPQPAPGQVDLSVPLCPEAPAPPPRLAPLAPQRFALQVTIGQETHDKLRHAQALLGHQILSRDVAQVLDRALDALIRELEKRKFAATKQPRRRGGRPSSNPRYIPAAVKSAVWKRDQAQCTFRSEDGRRCPARSALEFDHVEPVARGGQATVGGIRLRCRAHNQYAAECAFGAGFMERKRERARDASAMKKARSETRAPVSPGAPHPPARLW